jgi:hypothetical protein
LRALSSYSAMLSALPGLLSGVAGAPWWAVGVFASMCVGPWIVAAWRKALGPDSDALLRLRSDSETSDGSDSQGPPTSRAMRKPPTSA